MEVIRIEYKTRNVTGVMELDIKMFFPCTLQAAKKIAPLINQGCTEEDRSELLLELHSMAESFQKDVQENKDILKEFKRHYAAMGSMTKPDFKAMKRCEIEIRKAETLKKRVEKNIKLIEEGERNGKI